MKRHFALAALLGPLVSPAAAAERTLEELVTAGQVIYEQRCAACHSKTGKGFVGPSFIGNDRIATDAFVIRQITRGGADMPPFGTRLSDDEILAVGTYVRNSWGNAYGVLKAAE